MLEVHAALAPLFSNGYTANAFLIQERANEIILGCYITTIKTVDCHGR